MFAWDEGEDQDDATPVRSSQRPEPTEGTYWLQVVLVLLTVVWLLAASWQAVLFLGDLAGGVGDSLSDWWPSDPDPGWVGRADAQRHARRAMLLSLLPAAGVLLALVGRRPVAAGLLGVGGVLGLLVGAGMYAAVTPDAPDVPERRAPYCAEYSGGDATCPGG